MTPINRKWIERLIADFVGAALALVIVFFILAIGAMLAQ